MRAKQTDVYRCPSCDIVVRATYPDEIEVGMALTSTKCPKCGNTMWMEAMDRATQPANRIQRKLVKLTPLLENEHYQKARETVREVRRQLDETDEMIDRWEADASIADKQKG